MNPGVKFIPWGDRFTTAIRLDDIQEAPEHLEDLLGSLAERYAARIRSMRAVLEANAKRKQRGDPVLATSMWGLGNRIFLLMGDLERAGAQMEDVYGHLERDLGVSRTLLSRVVTLRRYVTRCGAIPPDLAWAAIATSPKEFAAGLDAHKHSRKKTFREDGNRPSLFAEP